MAEIKGITIELNGDTSGLIKAINKVRQETKSFDKELGYIDNSLKFNPRNVDLLRQKIAVLTDTTKAGEKNISEMKKALAEMKAKGVDETSAEYRELEREIIRAESKQKAYNKELAKVKAAVSHLGRAGAAMKEFGSKAEAAGNALRGVSTAAAGIDAALLGLAYKSGQAADDLNTLSKVTGISTQELQKYKAAADLVDVSVDAIAKSQIKLKKNMYEAQQGSESIQAAFKTLGVSVTDSSGELRSQDEVFSEVIASLGQMENETERDAIAMEIFGKSASQLNPLIEDNGETYKRVADVFAQNNLELVDQETIDKANQFNDTIDEIKATGAAALQSIGMQLAGYLQPALEKVAAAIESVFSWLSQLDPQVLAILGVIAGVVAGLAPVLIVVGKLATAIGSIMSLASTLGPVLAGVGGTLLPIIGIIAGVVAAGVLLYKNWDKIKAFAIKTWTSIKTTVTTTVQSIKTAFNNLKTTVSNIFSTIKAVAVGAWNGIKFAITHPIDAAVLAVRLAIQKIKGFFSGLSLKLPHIKLPHFKLTGKLSLAPPSVPKLSIDWYKDGGIFASPTVFSGVGVGEAGPEAVLPLKKLWDEMDKRFTNGPTINVYGAPGQDVRELAQEVGKVLVELEKRKRNAWAF